MRVCLFEHHTDTLEPIALTRPVFDLICGLGSLGEKQRRAVGATTWSGWVRPMLAPIARQMHPGISINNSDAVVELWLNARWLPPSDFRIPTTTPAVGKVDGEIAWIIAPAHRQHIDFVFDLAAILPVLETSGTIVRYPWDLVDCNAAEIVRDVNEVSNLPTSSRAGLIVVGPTDKVFIHASARIDPLVVLDATPGPIVIGENAVVTAFTRIEGPCVIGANTHLMGAKIRGGVSIGPQCRIGGEIETSIVQGYTNKYHEGFLGHSYLGEWVNLGAGTHNSDLRNDYGDVTVTIAGRPIATGRPKVGCFLGDHTRTGLGSLLNTGTNIGPFCNVLPAGRFAPKHMPAFTTWWNGQLRLGFPMTQLLATAAKVMQRRGQTLTTAHVGLFEKLWEITDLCRCESLANAETKQRRRAA